jgi:serine/threonine-protein kinase
MGEVFRAFDTDHERLVALKRLAAHLADDPEFQGRFRREAQLAAKLRNPHIVPIHRFGELDGHLFIDMRYIEGYDVAELIDTVGALEPSRAVSILEQVGSALATAHAAGLVHRDVKPSNLLVDQENSQDGRDFVYLVDFGISRAVATTRSHSLTRTGALLGSLAYMAPEQFDGMADSRVDVYALTCVFFELLTGSKPYQGDGLPALMHAHVNVPPPAPSAQRPGLSASFDDVIRRGMAKQPADRYSSTAELARAARSALTDHMGGEPDQPSHVLNGTSKRAEEAAEIVRHREITRHKPAEARHELHDSDADASQALSDGHHPRDDILDDQARAPHPVDLSIKADRPAAPPVNPGDPTRSEQSGRNLAGITTRFRTRRLNDGRGRAAGGSKRTAAVFATVLAVTLVGALVLLLSRPATTAGAPGAVHSAIMSVRPSPTVQASTGKPSVEAAIQVGQAPQGIAQSPDGHTVYVAETGARSLAVVDTESQAVRSVVPLPGVPRYVAAARDGRRVFVSMFADDGSGSGVAVINMPGATFSRVITIGPKPYALATAPDGRIYVPNHDASSIAVLDPETLQVTATVAVSNNPHAVAFSPRGDLAYSANHESNTVAVIDTATEKVRATVPVGNSPHSLTVSPDGAEIATANYGDNTISIISSASDAVVQTFPAGLTPQSLTYSADGRHLYVGNESANEITTMDAHTGQVASTIPVGDSPRFVLGTPDGTRLLVSSSTAGELTILRAAP